LTPFPLSLRVGAANHIAGYPVGLFAPLFGLDNPFFYCGLLLNRRGGTIRKKYNIPDIRKIDVCCPQVF
jgi:hypothetical protein